MRIIPAIDLLNGEAVRLFKGDFDEKTTYSKDPVAVARSFMDEGADFLHVVDLNGANGDERQTTLIEEIVNSTNMKVQVGGGIKTSKDIMQLLNAGVSKVILGSLAVDNLSLVKTMISQFGAEKIIIALDVQNNSQFFEVKVSGWTKESGRSIDDLLDEYSDYEGLDFLVTDISKDGTLLGPNFTLYEQLSRRKGSLNFIVSGGISSLDDVRKANSVGARGVILGKAIYEKKFSVEDALRINHAD